MSSSITNMLREIDEAQARSMELLLQGWQREIEAHEHTLVEARRRAVEQQAQDAAISSALASFLNGLVDQAKSGDDVTASIPTGFRVASESICAPSASAISALISEVAAADDPVAAEAQRSAAWAVSNGFVPHPGDLATIMRSTGIDDAWAQRFEHNGKQLEQLEPTVKNPQLSVFIAATRLDIVKDTVRLLDAYTPERTLKLVGNPQSLLETPGKVGSPSASSGLSGGGGAANPRMGRGAFNRMLDGLFC
jgi:hypothetical protein